MNNVYFQKYWLYQSLKFLRTCLSLKDIVQGNLTTSYSHRIGVYGGDLRESVIDKHISIWVDRRGSWVLVENRFSWSKEPSLITLQDKEISTLPCFPDTTMVTFLGPMKVPPGLQVMLPKILGQPQIKLKRIIPSFVIPSSSSSRNIPYLEKRTIITNIKRLNC